MNLIDKLIDRNILSLNAYHVQSADGLVKLDMMENPYPWPEQLLDPWHEKLKNLHLNRYPDATAQSLKQILLKQNAITDNCDVMFGNGSDELIQIVIHALSRDAGPVMSVAPTFSMYKIITEVAGKNYVEVALNDDFTLDISAFLTAIQLHKPACIFIAYPNNPTGNLFPQDELRQLLDAAPGLVVIDEAYLPFAGVTLIDWLTDYPQMLVMRTFSKAGLAGLRFGMLFGANHWLEQFNKIRLPFNINSLTQASVEFALENIEVFENNAQYIVDERERVASQLKRIDGVAIFDSEANFILFRSNQMAATQLFEELLERHILIKCLHGSSPMLDQCLRVTIGTEHENNLFLDSIRDILKQSI